VRSRALDRAARSRAAAAEACRRASRSRAAWLQLAAALAAAADWRRVLVALNLAPPVSAAEEAAACRGLPQTQPPPPARATGRGALGAEAALAARCSAELERAAGREALMALPAAALLPPPEQLAYAAGGGLAAPPPPPAAAAAAAAYALLVEAVSALGWEALLELRSDVFAMEGCGEAPPPPGEAAAADAAALLSAAPLPRRRLCADWLDSLFGALYADVAEFSEWRCAEAAEEGTAEAEAALGTHGDWLRRGALCERLRRGADAERAYRIAVHLSFSLGAWAALARLYADWGWAPEALTALGHIAQTLGCEADDPPPCIAAPIAQLVATVGLQAVREAQADLDLPATISELLFDAVRWKMTGFDA